MSRPRWLQRIVVHLLLLPFTGIVHAQASQDEFSVSTWVSEGTTFWGFNTLSSYFGNPTSELEYKSTSSNLAEFSYLHPLKDNFFIRARVGGFIAGNVRSGTLYDADYLSAEGSAYYGATVNGAHRFSYTESEITDGGVGYFSVELGKSFSINSTTFLRAYIGYQYWQESYTAEDFTQLECTVRNISLNCANPGEFRDYAGPAISNNVYWGSLNVGIDGTVWLGQRVSMEGSFALSPFVRLMNEDTHHLRNLPSPEGSTGDPSFVMTGNGWGANVELMAAYQVSDRTSVSLGYRYWQRVVTRGSLTAYDYWNNASGPYPLTDFYTTRAGWLLSLTIDL